MTVGTPQTALPDLAPARWIWYPSERTLPNTFVLFRREIELRERPRSATGWVVGDSRYKLEVNGHRIQWGPTPCDPRSTEADPVDLTRTLQSGKNVLGATVLYYGLGDGTWPTGNPGFLFWLGIEYPDGSKETVVSDHRWKARINRAWAPGRYKRWYLRALQEQFDARLHPEGWSTHDFTLDRDWLDAMILTGNANKPTICTNYVNYLEFFDNAPREAQLLPRSIPLLDEPLIPVARLAESLHLNWHRDPSDYFENRTPYCFEVDRSPAATQLAEDSWSVNLDSDRAAVLTFELGEQVVGFPYFSITASAGTVVDLITQEGHEIGGAALLYTTLNYSWSQFVCRNGSNSFECFDFESLRWLQLHIRGQGAAQVSAVGVRRRVFPWRNQAMIKSNEPALQRLFEANINTLRNSATDQYVDGNGRERQSYAGDASHQVSTSLLVFGDARLSTRWMRVWSQGLTKEGYFFDMWPAHDCLARIAQRQLDLTQFGPLLDNDTEFIFDAWDHYMITGDLESLRALYPRLLRFAEYLRKLIGRDGDALLPVVDLG